MKFFDMKITSDDIKTLEAFDLEKLNVLKNALDKKIQSQNLKNLHLSMESLKIEYELGLKSASGRDAKTLFKPAARKLPDTLSDDLNKGKIKLTELENMRNNVIELIGQKNPHVNLNGDEDILHSFNPSWAW